MVEYFKGCNLEGGIFMRFLGRLDAGEQLSEHIKIDDPANAIVLGLPRGGVPLGLIIAQNHSVPFDVVLAKKLVHPTHTEFAIGALAEGGEPNLNQQFTLDDQWIEQEVQRVRAENKRRRALYDEVIEHQILEDKDVILVDDGIATGSTMFAAIQAVKKNAPRSITVAVPVIPKETYYALEKAVDNICYVLVPSQFLGAVGAYYRNFPSITDEEILEMLKSYRKEADEKKLI